MDNINELSIDIKKRFQSSSKWPHADKVKAQKFQKDFNNKMLIYTNLLDNYRERKATQLIEQRQTLARRRQTIQQRKRGYEDQESEREAQIQLQEVNQQTLFQQHMLQLKQKQLLQIKGKMQEALTVQKQVARLVNDQGKQIDQIQDNVDTARSNVKQAGELLQQGVEHHKSANKKKMCIIGVIFIALLIIVVPIVVKFAA